MALILFQFYCSSRLNTRVNRASRESQPPSTALRMKFISKKP